MQLPPHVEASVCPPRLASSQVPRMLPPLPGVPSQDPFAQTGCRHRETGLAGLVWPPPPLEPQSQPAPGTPLPLLRELSPARAKQLRDQVIAVDRAQPLPFRLMAAVLRTRPRSGTWHHDNSPEASLPSRARGRYWCASWHQRPQRSKVLPAEAMPLAQTLEHLRASRPWRGIPLRTHGCLSKQRFGKPPACRSSSPSAPSHTRQTPPQGPSARRATAEAPQ
mmetsp:Transcript_38129/g.101410  ORF Transcript_38129/g.101410 Transcript_38129/m.101410 type:complete len:222 (-) Transcript_38129:773-1438(-)